MSSQNKREWFAEDVVLAVHEAQVAEHGGAAGVRDRGLLESALARPQHAAAYSDAEVPELAVLYALGIIENHPFVDGNKRVGTVLIETFLQLHGHALVATDRELLSTIVAVASGKMRDKAFVAWVRERARPL